MSTMRCFWTSSSLVPSTCKAQRLSSGVNQSLEEAKHWRYGRNSAVWWTWTFPIWRSSWTPSRRLHYGGPRSKCFPDGHWPIPPLCGASQAAWICCGHHWDAAHLPDFSFWWGPFNCQSLGCTSASFPNNTFGFAQAFIIKGETPMLMGRPIIEALGIVINFKRQQMMFEGYPCDKSQLVVMASTCCPWLKTTRPSLLIRYLPLIFDLKTNLMSSSLLVRLWTFRPTRSRKVFSTLLTILRNNLENDLSWSSIGRCSRMPLPLKRSASRLPESFTTLRQDPGLSGRSICWRFKDVTSGWITWLLGWEVWLWDRLWLWPAFTSVLLLGVSGPCGAWWDPVRTKMWLVEQNASNQCHHRSQEGSLATTATSSPWPSFAICEEVLPCPGPAHLEQPHGALSWETTSLKSLPGLYVIFDQCCYGAMCLDVDGQWKPVKKATGLKTTKRAMAQAMCLRCDGSHEHCRLEGQFPGIGHSRTSYMEDYQPAMAAVLAAAMAAPEDPSAWEDVNAVEEVRYKGSWSSSWLEIELKPSELSSDYIAILDLLHPKPYVNFWNLVVPQKLSWKLHDSFNVMPVCAIESQTKLHLHLQRQWASSTRLPRPMSSGSRTTPTSCPSCPWSMKPQSLWPRSSSRARRPLTISRLWKDVGFPSLDHRPNWSLMKGAAGFMKTLEFGRMNMEFFMPLLLARPMNNLPLWREDMLSCEKHWKSTWPTMTSMVKRPSNRPWPISCPRSTTLHRLQAFHLLNGFLDSHQIYLANFLELHWLQFILVNPLKMNLPEEPLPKWPSSRPTLTRSSDEPCLGSMPVPTSCSSPDRNASLGATAGQQTLWRSVGRARQLSSCEKTMKMAGPTSTGLATSLNFFELHHITSALKLASPLTAWQATCKTPRTWSNLWSQRGVTRFVNLSIQNKRNIDDIGTDEEVMDDNDDDQW